MSKFNKCKDCGDTSPVSGWRTSSASLCNDCARTRIATMRERQRLAKIERDKLLAALRQPRCWQAGVGGDNETILRNLDMCH